MRPIPWRAFGLLFTCFLIARTAIPAPTPFDSVPDEGRSDPRAPVAPTTRPAAPKAPVESAAPTPFRGGVCWVGGADREGLRYLAERGVEWISVTPFAYGQKVHDRPPEGGYRASRFRGESRDGIAEVITIAHELGLKVLLKPHIWFTRDGKWRGDIAMTSDEDWATWFAMLDEFLDPFVTLAVEKEVAAFCVGCELAGTIAREDEWRALIAKVRARYDGELTFAANWHDEYASIEFWDALDWIGVQAYFPLSDSATPTEDELHAGWKRWKGELARVSARWGKPIVFTEIGYRPEADNAREPWGWRVTGERDPEAQARAFRALFRAWEGESWLGGIHVWKWFAGYREGEAPRRRRGHDSFSPQGLPAETVIFEGLRAWGGEGSEDSGAGGDSE